MNRFLTVILFIISVSFYIFGPEVYSYLEGKFYFYDKIVSSEISLLLSLYCIFFEKMTYSRRTVFTILALIGDPISIAIAICLMLEDNFNKEDILFLSLIITYVFMGILKAQVRGGANSYIDTINLAINNNKILFNIMIYSLMIYLDKKIVDSLKTRKYRVLLFVLVFITEILKPSVSVELLTVSIITMLFFDIVFNRRISFNYWLLRVSMFMLLFVSDMVLGLVSVILILLTNEKNNITETLNFNNVIKYLILAMTSFYTFKCANILNTFDILFITSNALYTIILFNNTNNKELQHV